MHRNWVLSMPPSRQKTANRENGCLLMPSSPSLVRSAICPSWQRADFSRVSFRVSYRPVDRATDSKCRENRRLHLFPGRPRASSCPPPPHCLTPLSPVPSRFALSQQVLHCKEASRSFLDGMPTHGPPAVATSRSRSGCGEAGGRLYGMYVRGAY